MTAALLLVSSLASYSLAATDDVWIYPHAFDQTGDVLLRAWGDGASAVGDPGASQHSFSLVRFDLSTVKEPASALKKATLVVWHDAEALFTANESKAMPLEARLVEATFDEKRWSFEQAATYTPEAGEGAIVGKASPKPSDDGKPFKIAIDLLGGKVDFRKAIDGKKAVAFALTTKMDPQGADGPYYRLLSRSAGEPHRPMLILEY